MDEKAPVALSLAKGAIMNDEWRVILYPFGFLSAFAFGARFLVQWLESEIKQRSVVRPSFWYLSITGNLLLWTHSIIQLQFHVCFVQICNAVIAWRNLNLMGSKTKQVRLATVLVLMGSGILLTAFIFILQSWSGGFSWIRIPAFPGLNASQGVAFGWHIIGTIAIVLFSLRFWVQWWQSERKKESYLSQAFWWTSVIGGLLTIIYFSRIQDPVNLIGPTLGMIPYIRNLMLMKQRS